MKNHSPTLEDAFHRVKTLGYDPPADVNCFVRCVSHGVPSRLIRWHYHEEYELHFVVASAGRFFVGDYIGNFQPGNLVLTGPRLPHNWISTDVPAEGLPLRDHCVIFDRRAIDQSSALMPELREVLPLLDRAARGVEFFGVSQQALEYFERLAASRGIARLATFLDLLGMLSRCEDYRVLSYGFVACRDDERAMSQIDEMVNYIAEHYAERLTLTDVARRFHMSESHFSRVFRRSTGNTFTDFLIHVRISRACQLLTQTDDQISSICYDIGFNNLANFNRRFLHVKGTTPSAFRHECWRRLNPDGHPNGSVAASRTRQGRPVVRSDCHESEGAP